MTYTFNRPSFPATRMRRIRKNEHLRSMVRETHLTTDHLIYPVFVLPGQNQTQDIPSMPKVQRLSADLLLKKAERLLELGVSKLAIFPVTPQEDKSLSAEAAWREDGVVQNTLRLLKKELPEMVLITDGALDPYTTHGQDGIIDDTGYVLNDETVEALIKQGLSHAEAGADVFAPSDMMDGRIGAIRQPLKPMVISTPQSWPIRQNTRRASMALSVMQSVHPATSKAATNITIKWMSATAQKHYMKLPLIFKKGLTW